jgi:UDP-N-acetylmuramate dehydrogenase
MIRFSENFSLKQYNTFGVNARARFFFEFTELQDLSVFLHSNKTWKEAPVLVLGKGSNLLFINDFEGLVLYPQIPGIYIMNENRQHIWVEAGAGETWDDFVKYAVDHQLGGIENLSLIPGTVGAAPVQNIGAYGQEVSHVIETVKGYDLQKNEPVKLPAKDCAFGYRDSLFKKQMKNRFVITSVLFKLEKFPEFQCEYSGLEEKVKSFGKVNLQNIRKAIIDIRSSKLPDVDELGNAGSFFMNPELNAEDAENIRSGFPDIPCYPSGEGKIKLAAGWLIEKAGWKGRREGDVGVHENQALVLVNYGNATGKEIFDFSEKIKQSVWEKFGLELQREVHII